MILLKKYEKMKTKNKITFLSNSKNFEKIFKNIKLFFDIKKLILNIFKKDNNLNQNFKKRIKEERIKKILLLNLFFSFYEDSFRKLINLNIKDLFFDDKEKFLNFKIKNDSGYTFKMPKNETYFHALTNSSFHNKNSKNHLLKEKWEKWIKNNFNKIKISINNLQITRIFENNKEDKFFLEIIRFTNKKVRKNYQERNNFNHSFEKWFDKSLDASETNIFVLFILLVLNLIIFDFYVNDSWKNLKDNFLIKKKFFELNVKEENIFTLNEFYQTFSSFLRENIDLFKDKNIVKNIIKNDNLEIKIAFKN